MALFVSANYLWLYGDGQRWKSQRWRTTRYPNDDDILTRSSLFDVVQLNTITDRHLNIFTIHWQVRQEQGYSLQNQHLETTIHNCKSHVEPHCIDNVLRHDNLSPKIKKMSIDNTVNLLLLGISESGKSTLFKQVKILHQNGYTKEELNSFKQTIQNNLVLGMSTLIDAAQQFFNMKLEDDPELKQHIDTVLKNNNACSGDVLTYDPSKIQSLSFLWNHPSIQKVYQQRHSAYQILDNLSYFMTHLERIGSASYAPTVDDVLHCRVRTTGVHETKFELGGLAMRLVDVGGQRNQRYVLYDLKFIHDDDGDCVCLVNHWFRFNAADIGFIIWNNQRNHMLLNTKCCWNYNDDEYNNKQILLFPAITTGKSGFTSLIKLRPWFS